MTSQQAKDAAGNTATISVIREGKGPEVLLVHGGASPATTWSGLEQLSERWTLMLAYRRGFAPSPAPPGGRQDFELDAADICRLLDNRPHLVGAGARVPDKGPLPDEVVRSIRRAQGSRPPSEVSPPLEVLREAGIRSLVASGDHHVAVERMCDAVATDLGAQRVIAPGAGHFVAAAPGFTHELESFLNSAE
jgi:hypothetical protein